MNIVVAPHMPVIVSSAAGNVEFQNLALQSLPSNVIILVPDKWEEFISQCEGIASDYELFSLLLELRVKEISPVKKAKYIRLTPDILESCDSNDRDKAKQQLFALSLHRDARRIYAGTSHKADIFEISSDRSTVQAIHFRLNDGRSLRELISSFEPKLDQLKHYQDARQDGGRYVSAFSAYDKNDERYAKELLKQAYEDHKGDIDDRTYLYTYDSKNKTFVEFRPNRGNFYHGQDVDTEYARMKAKYIVELYHK